MLVLAWFASQSRVQANPTGGTVTQGSATFSSSGSQFTINQISGNTVINWQTFNIAQGETTTFTQPSANSIAWNNIGDANASQIMGNLNANGYVVLQNPNGFTIGGQAAITTHGLVMTTANTPPPNFASGSPWTFDVPAPTAKIINYGEINVAGSGPLFLIANDIENNGTISAPNGQIGLYAGEKVMVSTSPTGSGLSAVVTLPQGSVDNNGNLIADAGSIVAQAQYVNQNGVIQANSVKDVNGTIELIGSDTVTLGANSAISAQGDSTATSASAGGSVQVQAGGSFSDAVGSSINVAGAIQGGNGGQISISAPQMTAVQSTLNGQAAADYLNGTLSVDTADIALNPDGSLVAGALALNVNALASGFSQINLQASDDITLGTQWILAPNGGISTGVSLQAGNEIELNSGSEIEADGGNITLNAPTVDQGGTLQANSVGSANGVIEIDASHDLILEASSVINANGDPTTTTTPSPGGFVVLNAGSSYSDYAGSTISVAGNAAGGQGGIVEIFDPQAGSTPIESTVSGAFVSLVNPYDMTLSGNSTGTYYDTDNNLDANFNVSDLNAYSQIDLQALDNVELSTPWTLNALGMPSVLSLTAGNNITLDLDTYIIAGQGWTVNLTAGTGFVPGSTPVSGSDGIYLDGNTTGDSSYIQSFDGNINLWAANEVQVGWTGSFSGQGSINGGDSSINTTGGGNIDVTTLYGDVNSGSNPAGFVLPYRKTAPYFSATFNAGGIGTSGGGNVTISAGGNVIGYMPSDGEDGGTGAYGSNPGNVTVTAGENVYGHYVVVNGTGDITAGQNIGGIGSATFALSLNNGGWYVNAPNGDIYLQEVRNPNGDFNTSLLLGAPSAGFFRFLYSPQAYVDLTANGVYLTDSGVPRVAPLNSPVEDIPVVYPPILDINAGSGGVTLEGDATLFPSVDQNLDINITDDGDLTSTADPISAPRPYELLMSDSSQIKWATGDFVDSDNGTVFPTGPQPAIINVSGSVVDLNLITSKATDLTVGGDIFNSGFSGQNLQASDITSINVAGQIFSTSPYSFVNLSTAIPNIPAGDLPLGFADSWNTIFTLAVDQNLVDSYQILPNTTESQLAVDVLEYASLFQDQLNSGILVPANLPGFVYNTATMRLGYIGQMPSSVQNDLDHTIYVLHLVNGVPVIDENPNDINNNPSTGRVYGELETDPVSWADPSAVDALATDAANSGAPPLSTVQLGYRVGGPGQFDVTAGSISLGASDGIVSCGVYDPQGGYDRYANLASITPVGATLDVSVIGGLMDPTQPAGVNNPYLTTLDMLSSTIASLDGGDVNVVNDVGSMDLGSPELASSSGGSGSATGQHLGFGIYSTGGGDVSVTALDDVDIDGSRIATYDGGNIFVESLQGTIDVGSGTADLNTIDSVYGSEAPQAPFQEGAFGSGIVANTLEPPSPGQAFPPDAAKVPGNITVLSPEGDIVATSAGIVQEALDGSITPGPTVTLVAGTLPSGTPGMPDYNPGYPGNIDLGNSGVIGGEVNLSANGNISGEVVSRQNSDVNAAQNFSGTLLSGGSASVTGGGTISGTIIGVGGANVSGAGGVTAVVLGQNVSVNGGSSQSTLGSSATATSATQSAAQQANSQSQQQVASDQTGQTDDNKKKKPQIRKVGRVTVILSAAVPQ
jgi:filamentous hemagglutinin family protein